MANSARDPLELMVRHDARFVGDGRDPAWLRAKLERECASPFGFLRGTFYLFVHDWPAFGHEALRSAAPTPIVGDLHLENFGAFRAADGAVVFDVNDFDETDDGTPALDLARLATSFVLADERHGDARAAARVAALVEAWIAAARSLDLRPLEIESAPALIRKLVASAGEASRAAWLDKRVEAEKRAFKSSDKYQRITDEKLRADIVAAVAEFGARCADRPREATDWPHVLDVATRLAGTGSLGRFRWAVLVQGKSEKPGKERILELKESLPSSLSPERQGDPAERVIALQHQLQGASPAYLGVAHVAGRACTVRELQPTEGKLDSSALKGTELDELAAACGTVLGRLHRRAAPDLPARLQGREQALSRHTIAFALRYAEQVAEDHALLVAKRKEVERALGI